MWYLLQQGVSPHYKGLLMQALNLKKKEIIKLLLVFGAVHVQLYSMPDPNDLEKTIEKEIRYNDPDNTMTEVACITPSTYPKSYENKLEELTARLNSTKNETLLQTWI
jgi:hypothetical protein